jgi:hypothetical protein
MHLAFCYEGSLGAYYTVVVKVATEYKEHSGIISTASEFNNKVNHGI